MKSLIALLILATSITAWAGKKKPTAPETSTIVVNQSTQTVTYQSNPDLVRSMASITKLMTAMVVLDTLPDLERRIKYNPGYLPGRDYTVKELLTLVLVRSDNQASELLSKSFYKTRAEFIDAMNEKALKLGMLTARFVDPSGVMADNSASATDIVKMLVASGTYPVIRATAGLKEVGFETKQGKHIRQVNLTNTNKDILFEFDNIVVSKTGTTTAAGKCLAMLVEKNGQQYAVVILGERTKQTRDQQARHILHTQLDARERVVW
jgi:D-alanyl-D-alanine endopeptidase (penicillin-binding protein 7)